MKTTFNVFAKKLFGERYNRITKWIFVSVMVYGGLRGAEYKINIAPVIIFFMSALFSAGVMRQAMGSKDNAEYIKNLVMMPFDTKSLMLSFVATLGIHTLLSKVALVWALCFAVCDYSPLVIAGGVIAGVTGILMSACAFVWKKFMPLVLVWGGAVIAVMFILRDQYLTNPTSVLILIAIMAVSSIVSLLSLFGADGYLIYDQAENNGAHKSEYKSHKHNLTVAYLLRYLFSHKNYLINTVFIWGVCLIIPHMITGMSENAGGGDVFVKTFIYIGFGIVSLNTPLCILVSCDPDLERGIKFLPNGVKSFCVPYGLFLFASNCVSFAVYLVSCHFQLGGIGVRHIICGLVLAALSATGSVALEWFAPIKNWKLESDLWHHPRKYAVPACILLIAGIIGSVLSM